MQRSPYEPAFSLNECKKLAELAEANCMADFCRAAPAYIAEAHGLYVEQRPSYTLTLVKDQRNFGMYNRVFALGVGQPTTEEEVEQVVDLYRQANLPFLVRLSPDAQPPKLLHWLKTGGLVLDQAETSARFYTQPGSLMPLSSPLSIREVGAVEAADFARIACLDHHPALQMWLLATLGRPGWHHYLAFEAEVPIATGVLYIQERIGWLGWAATLPAYRRKGAHQALLVHRLNEAMKMGCVLVSAETRGETEDAPNPSYHNLQRLGFQLAYLRLHYHFDPVLSELVSEVSQERK